MDVQETLQEVVGADSLDLRAKARKLCLEYGSRC